MSPLIPAAVLAAAGYHGGLSPQILALLSFLTASIGISLLGVAHLLRQNSTERSSRLAVLLICCAVATLTGRSASVRSEAAFTPVMPADSSPRALEGVVGRVSTSGDTVTALVRLEWAQSAAPTGDATVSGSAGGTVSIRLPRTHTVAAGRRYRFLLTPHRAPWDTAGAPVYHADAALPLQHSTARAAVLSLVRDRVGSSGGEAAPLLLALLLGEDESLSPAVLSSFRRSGTLHLLALSGMHLGVLALVAGATAKRVAGQTAGVVVAVLAACVYLALIGPRPGLVRATLLLAVGAVVRLAGKRPALVDLLAATFLLHLLLAPVGAFSLAFGLSYASLAGIAIVTPVLLRWGETLVPAGVLGPVAAGAGAQLATVPLVVVTFGAIYPVGIVATAVLGPLVLFFMITGAFLVATDLPWLYDLLVPVLERLSLIVSELARVFAKVPGIELSKRVANEASPVIAGVTLAFLLAALALGSYYRYHRVGDSLVRTRR